MKPDYAGYEAAKRAWIHAHPRVSAEIYEAAMRALAKKYGV